MFLIIKKRVLLICTCLSLLSVCTVSSLMLRSRPTFDPTTTKTIIIDPGHGGNDPGAIGISGSCEKDINLAVSLMLRDLAEKNGFNVVMTRETDIALYDSKADNKKRSDLQNRKKSIENIPSSVFVSIHMNKFEQASVKGAQTFYASTEESEALAESVQESIKRFDTSNRRVAMKTPKTVYLLQNAKRPSILVEGGFLSNPTEERKLLDKAYQAELAQAILNGIKNFLNTPVSAE